MLKIEKHSRTKEIRFCIDETAEDLINKLSFTHLIEMKFDGNRIETSSSILEGNTVLTIRITFSEWQDYSNAEAHCNQNIGQDGEITPQYSGAISHADPGNITGYSIRERALENRIK